MATEKEVKWRVGAYVSKETYQKIQAMQYLKKEETGRKYSQGQVLDDVFKDIKVGK
ncbi:hypothetical protein P6Z85_14560 [Enterococcus faecium]|uniref:Uncharacterized protein n=1 Tax=Enterococcus faecium TaxID=1352 RepID=A0AAW8RKI9_ENTFC|nr:hypothetical protein [Enterococcus faecium]MDT2371329.1 hypothetical protein [Enterococcus faecium]